LNTWHLQQARRYLTAGGIIAYPTEAVYGLGCDPWNQQAVNRLLALKKRSWRKGLILIAANYAQLTPFLEPLTPLVEEKVLATWPGPVTWLLPAQAKVPGWLRGQSSQLAVRVTAHIQAAQLCHIWGGALVSTSANFSGQPATKTALKVRQVLGQQLDYIVPGAVGGSPRPSEIRDALTDKVFRY
jgi:L-threonylcarbamoyladenylate synthase